MNKLDNQLRRMVPQLRGFSASDVLLAFGLCALMVWATREALWDIVLIAFKDEESSHVQLVPLVAAWIAWVRRGRLRQCRPEGRLLACAGLMAGYALWLYGFWWQRESFWHAGAVLLCTSAFLVGVGTQVVWRFIPVFGTLIFLVPVPNAVRTAFAIPLQELTANITQQVCEVVGMNVVRQRNLLTINGMEVAVAEACNGMRMVFTLLLVCYAFTFTEPLRLRVRVLILGASPVVSVVANIIRLVPTVWAYGYWSKEAAGHFHDVSGWAMLVIAFLMLSGIVKLLRWALVPVSPFNLALS